MTCRACGSSQDRVTKSIDADSYVLRVRTCGSCKATWRTREVREITSQVKPYMAKQGAPHVANATDLTRESDLNSGSVFSPILIADPDLSSVVSKQEEGKKTRGKATAFPAEFETLWAATGRQGHKVAAHKAWVKSDRPDPTSIIETWSAYVKSLPEWRQPKDLSSWLNLEGHLQAYAAAPPPAPTRAPLLSFDDQRKLDAQAEAERLLAQRKRSDAEAQAIVDRVKAQGVAR